MNNRVGSVNETKRFVITLLFIANKQGDYYKKLKTICEFFKNYNAGKYKKLVSEIDKKILLVLKKYFDLTQRIFNNKRIQISTQPKHKRDQEMVDNDQEMVDNNQGGGGNDQGDGDTDQGDGDNDDGNQEEHVKKKRKYNLQNGPFSFKDKIAQLEDRICPDNIQEIISFFNKAEDLLNFGLANKYFYNFFDRKNTYKFNEVEYTITNWDSIRKKYLDGKTLNFISKLKFDMDPSIFSIWKILCISKVFPNLKWLLIEDKTFNHRYYIEEDGYDPNDRSISRDPEVQVYLNEIEEFKPENLSEEKLQSMFGNLQFLANLIKIEFQDRINPTVLGYIFQLPKLEEVKISDMVYPNIFNYGMPKIEEFYTDNDLLRHFNSLKYFDDRAQNFYATFSTNNYNDLKGMFSGSLQAKNNFYIYNKLQGIKNLKYLSLISSLSYKFLESNILNNLTNLRRLNLSKNSSEINFSKYIEIGKGLNKLTNLTHLDLSSNIFKTFGGLDTLINLTHLDLSKSYISAWKMQGLNNLVNLTQLNLSNIKTYKSVIAVQVVIIYRIIKINEIKGLNNLVNLTQLDLSKNEISKLENLNNLLKLTKLDLSDNKILKLENLNNLKNLRDLNLSKNKISKLENLNNLKNLRELNLSKNEIVEIKIDGNNLLKLTKLDLSYNEKLKGNEIKKLNAFKKLITLNITRTLLHVDNNKGLLYDYKNVWVDHFRTYLILTKYGMKGNIHAGKYFENFVCLNRLHIDLVNYIGDIGFYSVDRFSEEKYIII